MLAEDKSWTRCRRIGESSGNIAGAGWVESAAAGNEGKSGVRMPLRSGVAIVEVIFGVSLSSCTVDYVSAWPSRYIYVSRVLQQGGKM